VSDPIVARWIADCGMATAPVKIKLTGESQADVLLQYQRLKRSFGALVHFGPIQHNRVGNEWIVFGTIKA
jgi:hypothetical protein